MKKDYRYLEVRRMFNDNTKTYSRIWVIWIQNRQDDPNFYFRDYSSASVKRALKTLMKVALSEANNE